MCWPGREQVCVAGRRAGVVAAVLVMLLCAGSAAGHCLSHISVTGEAMVTGNADTVNVTLLLRETTEVGRLLYRLAWGEEVAAPNIPEPEEFASYFLVDNSVAGELRVLLKRSLVGLPDYPMLKTDFSTLVALPAFSDGRQCLVRLSHLLQDDNTHAPDVEASLSFLQVAKSFPAATPLQGVTVTVTDNDATAPNNLMELGVEGACPLAVAAAAETTAGTEAGRYGGAAGQRHTVRFHLTSPLHDLGNETLTCVLRVTDLGSPPLSSTVTFTLQVVDEESPITSSINTDTPLHLALPFYLAEVWPGMDAGTPLTTSPESVGVQGGDPTLQEVTYTLRDAWPGNGTEYFAINSATGQVRLRRTLDATVPTADGGNGGFVPILIQAQDSSGRVSTAVLQVRMSSLVNPKQTTHDLQPSSRLVSSSHPQPSQSHLHPSTLASPSQPNSFIHPAKVSLPDTSSHPQALTHTDSLAACLCPSPSSRGRARLDFSRLSYAAEVFLKDTFVGRVEARVVGLHGGLVHYSWAPGTNTTSFLVNGTSGVISVAPAGVSPGQHHLTIRATAGPLTTTAQVTVRVREEVEEKKTKKKKQDDDGDVFIGLLSGYQKTCDPEELVGLKVAVGVLAALLGVVLLAGCVVGALLYRRRKARARTEVKHISTLGSAYPNLSFSRDSPE